MVDVVDIHSLLADEDACLYNYEYKPIIELCELKYVAPKNEDTLIPIHVFCRFGTYETKLNGTCYEIGVKKASLCLIEDGFEVLPHDKLGEVHLSKVAEQIEEKTLNKKKFEIELNPKIEYNTKTESLSGSLGKIAHSITTNLESSSKSNKQDISVQARNGHIWTIALANTQSQIPITGLALNYDRLCYVKRTKSKNGCELSMSITVNQRDLSFSDDDGSPISKGVFGNRNKDKLTRILMAKNAFVPTVDMPEYLGKLCVAHGVIRDFEIEQ